MEWPRNREGEVIFSNSHEAIFYAILVHNAKALVEEIEGLSEIVKRDLYLEQIKPDGNPDLMIQLVCKHSFYRGCIDTAKSLLQEEVR